jgi:hypothetical protein
METIMKTLIAAFALTIAFPATGQQAPHSDHAQHQSGDHGKEHRNCCEHKNKDGTPMKCCADAMKSGKTPECCEKAKSHDQHQGMKH